MSTAKSLQAEEFFRDVAQFISESRALLEQGAFMELVGLDDQIRTLCEAVLQLSQEQRVQYAEKLQQLLGDLQSLGDTMVQQRDRLAEDIKGAQHHKKASVAYRIVDASDDFGDRDEEK